MFGLRNYNLSVFNTDNIYLLAFTNLIINVDCTDFYLQHLLYFQIEYFQALWEINLIYFAVSSKKAIKNYSRS
ncbi:hypothetical protein NSTC745_06241 [Nostoc sp. DSM 114161]|jgi:hypothetical protein